MNTEDTELVRDLREVAEKATKLADAMEAGDAGGPVCWPATVKEGLLDLSSHANRMERGRRWGRR